MKFRLVSGFNCRYLHSAAYPPIYHRDVKTSNILLDDKYVVKVSDFGISRFVKPDATHVSTAVQGTPGYLDPEYFHSYQLTEKSDVYSFGVVLLELITSLKPLDFERDSKDINLTAMVLPFVRMGNVEAIMDPRLVDKDESNFTQMLQEIQNVAELSSRCLANQRHDRPSMKEVVGELLAIKGVPQREKDWSDIDSFEPGELEMLPILDGFDTNSTAYTNSSCASSNDPLVISGNIKPLARDVNAR
jgi:serine/threonine protein kinase